MNPFANLVQAVTNAPIRAEFPAVAPRKEGTRTAELLAILADCASMPTLALAARTDLTANQVWGLLKVPREHGQVHFANGRWSLNRDFAGRQIEKAAQLLREHGWKVERPVVS